jgi:hypothetical protein
MSRPANRHGSRGKSADASSRPDQSGYDIAVGKPNPNGNAFLAGVGCDCNNAEVGQYRDYIWGLIYVHA